MLVNHDLRYVYVSVPKAGTHTMFYVLSRFYGGLWHNRKTGQYEPPKRDKHPLWIERYGSGPICVPHHPHEIPPECRDYFKFSVVRDPYTRAVSAWRSTTLPGKHILKQCPNPENLSLWLKWATAVKHYHPAVRRQVDQLRPVSQYDAILHLESLAAEFCSLPFWDGRPKKWPGRESVLTLPGQYSNGPEETLSPDDVALVNKFYAADFEAFDYRMQDP